jgi:hypothetical protein
MPIGAGLADKIGRKPIFFFGFMMGMKGLLCNLIDSTEYMIHRDVQVRKPPLAPAFYAENDRFTKTGSGHTNIRGTKHSQKRSIPPRLIDRYRDIAGLPALRFRAALWHGLRRRARLDGDDGRHHPWVQTKKRLVLSAIAI